MKIRLLSDLHLDRYRDRGRGFIESLDPTGCDLLVLAGDITTQRAGIQEALTLFCKKFNNVAYVLGNHEYYDSDRGRVNVSLRKACAKLSNLRVLDNDIIEIGGHRVLGTTLWFRRSRLTDLIQSSWSDFCMIRGFSKWVYEANEKAIKFLTDVMREGDIVISHYLPSHKSVSLQYLNSDTNCYFVCDMEGIILERKPALWLHGHTHCSMDYKLDTTRVVCNPFGYLSYIDNTSDEFNVENKHFNAKLEIEV